MLSNDSAGQPLSDPGLAPRRQSLPVPHAPSSQLHATANEGGSVSCSPHCQSSSQTNLGNVRPYSPSQSRFSMYDQKPTSQSWVWSQGADGTACTAAQQSPQLHFAYARPGLPGNATGHQTCDSPVAVQPEGVGYQLLGSPSQGPMHATPSVNITINGFCPSPPRQQVSAAMQSCDPDLQQQPQTSSQAGLPQQQQVANHKLDHEASLAHLHQTSAPVLEPVQSKASVPMPACNQADRTDCTGGAHQQGLSRAQSDAASTEAFGSAAQVELGAGHAAAWLAGPGSGAGATPSTANAAPDVIDTAALQQEVRQLRQQVRACCY